MLEGIRNTFSQQEQIPVSPKKIESNIESDPLKTQLEGLIRKADFELESLRRAEEQISDHKKLIEGLFNSQKSDEDIKKLAQLNQELTSTKIKISKYEIMKKDAESELQRFNLN